MNLETELFQFEEGGPELKYSELSPEQKWKVDDKLLSESSELFQFEEGGASLPYSELNQEQKAIVHSKFDMSSLSRSDTAENTEQKEEQGFSPLRYMRDTAVGTYNAARRGFYDTAAGIEGNIATVADDLGFEGAADYLEDSAKRTRSYGESIYQPKVQSYKDIDSFSALDTYLGERLGMAAPSIALYANPAGGTTINAISAGGNIAIDENFSDQINTTDMVVKGGQSALLDLAGLKGLKGFQWAAASPVASGLDQIATNLIKGDDALVNVDEAVAGGTLTSMAIKAPAAVASAASATTRKGRDVLSKGLNKASDLSFVDSAKAKELKSKIGAERRAQGWKNTAEAKLKKERDLFNNERDSGKVLTDTAYSRAIMEGADDSDLNWKLYDDERPKTETELELAVLDTYADAGIPLTRDVVKGTSMESDTGLFEGILTVGKELAPIELAESLANTSLGKKYGLDKLTNEGKLRVASKEILKPAVDDLNKLADNVELRKYTTSKVPEDSAKWSKNRELVLSARDRINSGMVPTKQERVAIQDTLKVIGFKSDILSSPDTKSIFSVIGKLEGGLAAKPVNPENVLSSLGKVGSLSTIGALASGLTGAQVAVAGGSKLASKAFDKRRADTIKAVIKTKTDQKDNLLKKAAKAVAPAEKNSYLRQARKLSQEIARLNASRDQLVEE